MQVTDHSLDKGRTFMIHLYSKPFNYLYVYLDAEGRKKVDIDGCEYDRAGAERQIKVIDLSLISAGDEMFDAPLFLMGLTALARAIHGSADMNGVEKLLTCVFNANDA